MIHALKILPGYFEDVISGKKTFEIRKNDRDYKVGDLLALNEYTETEEYIGYTGRSCLVKVDYILDNGAFLPEGFIAMSIKPCSVGINDGFDPRFNRDVYGVPVISREASK